MGCINRMECSRKSSTSAKDFEGFCRAHRDEIGERLFRDAANASLLSSRQPIRHRLPPIEDQLLPALELSREIGERPFADLAAQLKSRQKLIFYWWQPVPDRLTA